MQCDETAVIRAVAAASFGGGGSGREAPHRPAARHSGVGGGGRANTAPAAPPYGHSHGTAPGGWAPLPPSAPPTCEGGEHAVRGARWGWAGRGWLTRSGVHSPPTARPLRRPPARTAAGSVRGQREGLGRGVRGVVRSLNWPDRFLSHFDMRSRMRVRGERAWSHAGEKIACACTMLAVWVLARQARVQRRRGCALGAWRAAHRIGAQRCAGATATLLPCAIGSRRTVPALGPARRAPRWAVDAFRLASIGHFCPKISDINLIRKFYIVCLSLSTR